MAEATRADYVAAISDHWRKASWGRGELEREIERLRRLRLPELRELAALNHVDPATGGEG